MIFTFVPSVAAIQRAVLVSVFLDDTPVDDGSAVEEVSNREDAADVLLWRRLSPGGVVGTSPAGYLVQAVTASRFNR